ncbi:MAG: protein kinase [Phycisphaerales bacterium]
MGDVIGPYELRGELGRGGMGVVYLAQDTRLGRDVAIKSLPEELAADPARLERFEREARTLATVSHPNIAGIYGVEEQDGHKYLVLEFVEGENLAERLDRGPLPVDEAVELAVQIAAGVEAAHEAGIIHRDLKPANIKITPDGVAKVLDFGLARADESQSSSGRLDSPTMTTPQPQHSPTIEGAILGTAAYMSPEQARGRRVDKRSDIWSFGVVLYEMLTGASPFVGETASDSIGAVLHKQFDLDQLPPGTPANVRRVLRRCLARNKDERFRDIGDARLELLEDHAVEEPHDHASRSGGVPAAAALVGAVVVAAVAGVSGWVASGALQPEPEPVVRKLEVFAAGPDERFDADSPRISPDGMKVAFVQDESIKIRDLSTFEIQTIAEAEGVRQIVWSPDGRALIYATRSELYRIPATGGGASRLGTHDVNFQMAWTDDDRLLFCDDGQLDTPTISAMPARGGSVERLLEANRDEVIDFHSITSIPGTDIILFVRHRTDQRTPIEAWDGSRSVVIADFDDTYMTAPVWSPSGHVLFTRGFGDLSLWAVPFSPERLEATGDVFLVQTDASAPSVSANGTLSFVRGSPGLGGELVWVMPDGSIETIGDGGEVVTSPIVSPDGTRVVFAGGSTPNDLEVWVRDIERGINTRISSLEGFLMPSAWSPDGTEIAVMNFNPAATENSQTTRFLAADGTGPTREAYPGLLGAFDADWKRAVLTSDPRVGRVQISAIDLEQRTVIGEVTSSENGFLFVSISPDGRHLLYSSRESGEVQIYCTSFPSGEGRWQVSSDGGNDPKWAPDGSSVYYRDPDDRLMQVSVTREPSLRFGIPQPAFPAQVDAADFAQITPVPDGSRFISVRARDDEAEATGFKVLLIENWFEEFRDR